MTPCQSVGHHCLDGACECYCHGIDADDVHDGAYGSPDYRDDIYYFND